MSCVAWLIRETLSYGLHYPKFRRQGARRHLDLARPALMEKIEVHSKPLLDSYTLQIKQGSSTANKAIHPHIQRIFFPFTFTKQLSVVQLTCIVLSRTQGGSPSARFFNFAIFLFRKSWGRPTKAMAPARVLSYHLSPNLLRRAAGFVRHA
jgi:hypothetical protein